MNFKCPQCGYKCNYMEIKADADLTAIIKLIPVFGKYSSLVWAYAELFGATIHKTKVKKFRLLLEEMAGLFQTGAFRYQKKTYKITPDGIAEALNITVHRDFQTRLENHNYFKKIMISIAGNEEKEAGRHAERELRKSEVSGQRSGVGREFTEEQRQANMKRLGEIMKTIS